MARKVGVIFAMEEILEKGVGRLEELNIDTIQMVEWSPHLLTQENADKIKALTAGKIEIASIWAGWSGPCIWNFVDGPSTLGLVPAAYRAHRVEELKRAADFACMLGVDTIATHLGYVPECPITKEYRDVLSATKHVADYCKSKGVRFIFETGEETPTALMRFILDLDNEQAGVNLDPANLIIYGKGNPIDALDMFNGRIYGVHIKDANYTTDPQHAMGEEQVVGQGSVNFPVFLEKLIKKCGYQGPLFIEREIEGDQQTEDIKNTVKFIKDILATIE